MAGEERMSDRRKEIDGRLRALGRPRPAHRVPPPEGRLSPDEQSTGELGLALAELGPVFADFGRYLSSRIDLLPRRDCLDLGAARPRPGGDCLQEAPPGFDGTGLVSRELGPNRQFHEFDPTPRDITLWTVQYHAWLAPGIPVAVRIVRPDAERWLSSDVPLLSVLEPWLELTGDELSAAIDDFSETLRTRLDQTQQVLALIRLAEDARAGGALGAPVCYRDYCTSRLLTLQRPGGSSLAESVDRQAAGRQLAVGWVRQAVAGRLVPFDFDLQDIRTEDERLVLTGGALESQNATGRDSLLRYLVAGAADDPDAAWAWIAKAAEHGTEGQTEYRLRCRLRQAVPFRDGEWSGDDRLTERLLVQWKAVREAGWKMRRHELHLYRGIQAISAALARLAPDEDLLLAALQDERLRIGMAQAQQVSDPRVLVSAPGRLANEMVRLPERLDEFLNLAADGRLHIKLHVPDAAETRTARNRTVSLVASLVTLVGVGLLVRHVSPAYGPEAERLGAVVLMLVGGWLLTAAARL
jgi:hypothetical protein